MIPYPDSLGKTVFSYTFFLDAHSFGIASLTAIFSVLEEEEGRATENTNNP